MKTSMSPHHTINQDATKAVSSGTSVPLQPLLQREIQRRFSQIEHHFTLAVSTLLDPRFKNLIFSDMAAVDKTVRRLKEDVSNLIFDSENHTSENEDDTTPPHSPPTIPQQSSTSSSLWSGFDETVLRTTLHHTNTTDGFIEVKRYFEAHVIDRKDDPLQWWKTNSPQFPHVMAIAKKYLAIPGSSVPSEWQFSKAGELISRKRSQLKPDNVNMILFLNKNS